MKRIISCFVWTEVLLASFTALYAQSGKTGADPVPVVLDFKEKKFGDLGNLENLAEGDYYYLQIDNINTNLYMVLIGRSDSVRTTELKVPGFELFAVDNLSKIIAGILPIGGLVTGAPDDKINEAIDGSRDLLEEGNKDFHSEMQKILKTIPKAPSDENVARALIEGYKRSLGEASDKLEAIQNQIEQQYFDYNRFLIRAQSEFPGGERIFDTGGLSLNALYTKLEECRRLLVDLETSSTATFETYVAEIKQYEGVVKGNQQLKEADEQLRSATQTLGTSLTKLRQNVSAENTIKYLNSIIHVQNNRSTTYKSLPMQFNKEEATLKISIVPRDDKALLNRFETELTFPGRKYEDFWGVSSGFFVSSLSSEAYSLRAIDTTTFTIIDEEPVKGEFGINVMMRRGWKTRNTTYFQVGLGPAVAISDKIRPRLFGGLGIASGKKHIVLFDVGGSLGYTEVLGRGLRPSDNVSPKPDNVLVSRLKAGVYFSISYLFLK